MKVAPVSADLLIKLALAGVAVGAIYYIVQAARGQVTSGLAAAQEWAANVAAGLNPTSDQNYAYRAASAAASALTGRDDTAGTAAAGAFHDQAVSDMLAGRTNVNGYYPMDNLGATP